MAKGYTQRRGIDYQDTFSPVMQPTVLRSLLAIGAEKDWEMEQVEDGIFIWGTGRGVVYSIAPRYMCGGSTCASSSIQYLWFNLFATIVS